MGHICPGSLWTSASSITGDADEAARAGKAAPSLAKAEEEGVAAVMTEGRNIDLWGHVEKVPL